MDDTFFAFTAGEFDPDLGGRSDLDKYDLGAQSLENYIVKYTGGVWKRPGTRLVSTAFTGADATAFAFHLSDVADESYIAIFGDLVLWLYQNETLVETITTPYVLSDVRRLRFSQDKQQIRITHFTYPRYTLDKTSGSWVFAELQPEGNVPLAQSLTAVDSGSYLRYIKVTAGGSGYDDTSTPTISDATGSGFVGIVTVSSGAITAVTISEAGTGYTAPTLTASVGSSATFEIGLAPTLAGFAVTASAVYSDGTESGPMRPAVVRDSINFTQTLGSATYSWAAVSGAVRYKIYRTLIVPAGADIHAGFSYGFIGESRGTTFTDNNITPDFTQTPSNYINPFAAGALDSVVPTAGGSGYLDTSTITVTDPTGSGFMGYPAVVGGEIIGIIISHPGAGYTSPVVTLSDGSGATFDVEVSPLTGIFPAVSVNFQRRTVYLGTPNEPMTLRGSRNDAKRGFSTNSLVSSSDPYTYTVDSDAVVPIHYALAAQQGMLIFTTQGVALLRATEGLSVNATNASLDPQSAYGADSAPPVTLGEDVAYVQSLARGMRMLSFNANARQFEAREMSTYSPHFFSGKPIRTIAFGLETQKLGFGIYEDGTAFACTVDRSQEVYAFSPISTDGKILDVVVSQQGAVQQFYFLVLRNFGGVEKIALEALRETTPKWIEDEVHLDCSMQTFPTYPATTATVTGTTGTIEVTTIADTFTGMEGRAISFGLGRGVIQTVISPVRATVAIIRDLAPQNRTFRRYAFVAGEWWIAPFITTVTGIELEGATVSVVGDGKQQSDKVVSGGAITLDEAAAIVHIGLKFSDRLRTMPLKGPEGKRHRISAVSVITGRVGAFSVDGYEISKRTDEPWAAGTDLTGREEYAHTSSGWSSLPAVEVESNNALPCQILRIIVHYDGGDYKPARRG
jgi:hypothetical protein